MGKESGDKRSAFLCVEDGEYLCDEQCLGCKVIEERERTGKPPKDRTLRSHEQQKTEQCRSTHVAESHAPLIRVGDAGAAPGRGSAAPSTIEHKRVPATQRVMGQTTGCPDEPGNPEPGVAAAGANETPRMDHHWNKASITPADLYSEGQKLERELASSRAALEVAKKQRIGEIERHADTATAHAASISAIQRNAPSQDCVGAQECCIDIFHDFDEKEVATETTSVRNAWKVGKAIISRSDGGAQT